jgi:ADP-heptose:LPS heptosyltransferase
MVLKREVEGILNRNQRHCLKSRLERNTRPCAVQPKKVTIPLHWARTRAVQKFQSSTGDHTRQIADFADTAALMMELDLIISVDTAVAHLAGALGKPVWTLLPFVPDWRWGLESETTPWYPTMRLFRQPKLGDWDSVIQRVAAELKSLAETRHFEAATTASLTPRHQ